MKSGGLRIDQVLLLPPQKFGKPAKKSLRLIVERRLPQIGKVIDRFAELIYIFVCIRTYVYTVC